MLFEENAEEAADAQGVDRCDINSGGGAALRQVIPELQKVAAVVADRVRGGIPLVPEVVDVPLDEFIHAGHPFLSCHSERLDTRSGLSKLDSEQIPRFARKQH